MIPTELIKPLDEIKTASNRILIICLILTIMFLGTFVVFGIRDNDKNCIAEKANKDLEIQRLNNKIYECEKEKIDDLRKIIEKFNKLKDRDDSIDNIIKSLKK